jgi:hypothetical protein
MSNGLMIFFLGGGVKVLATCAVELGIEANYI